MCKQNTTVSRLFVVVYYLTGWVRPDIISACIHILLQNQTVRERLSTRQAVGGCHLVKFICHCISQKDRCLCTYDLQSLYSVCQLQIPSHFNSSNWCSWLVKNIVSVSISVSELDKHGI